MFIILYYFIWCFSVLLLFWYYWIQRDEEAPPLYRRCIPLIGHVPLVTSLSDTEELFNMLDRLSMDCVKAGGVIRLYSGLVNYYIITDPEDAITAGNACPNKHYVYTFAKRWLADGLVTASGDAWKRHRKLLSPAFSLQIQLSFLQTINEQARITVDELESRGSGEPFDISMYFRKLSLRNLFLTSFGIPEENDNIFDKYADGITEMLNIVTSRFLNMFLHVDFFYWFTKMKVREDKAMNTINDMAYKIIRKKRQELTKGYDDHTTIAATGGSSKPFLDLLLELSDGDRLSDKEIKEEIDTILVAGMDTSTWVLTMLLAYVGSHPEVQTKVYNEILEVIGADRDVHKYDLPKLVYMEAVIKETLRQFPVAPISLRKVDQDVKLKNCTLRTGSYCIISGLGMHRDPCWGEDSDQFRPERWLEPGVPQQAFAGFGVGKRICIGRTYAMISMKTTLCHLFRRYKVTSDSKIIKRKYDFIMKPVSGHFVSIERRNNVEVL